MTQPATRVSISNETSRAQRRTGVVLSTIAAICMILDGIVHISEPAPDGFAVLGFPTALVPAIVFIQLACLAIYLVPRTAVFGAVLLTGYFGGAVAIQLRVGHLVGASFPIIVAILLWGGLYLRDVRLRALFPLLAKQ